MYEDHFIATVFPIGTQNFWGGTSSQRQAWGKIRFLKPAYTKMRRENLKLWPKLWMDIGLVVPLESRLPPPDLTWPSFTVRPQVPPNLCALGSNRSELACVCGPTLNALYGPIIQF